MARHALRTTPNLQEQSRRGTDFERHRSIVVLGEDARSLRRGFTIVELLIVVVVIAILAAITIVAYNGIQNRAKASAAQAAAKQAFTKIQTFAVSNADTYPADLAAAGLTNSGNTGYQYRVDNNASPRNFCLTTTNNGVSYYTSNISSSPTAGACPGHAANGGSVITNLLLNPSVETSAAATAGAGAGTLTNRDTSQAFVGAASLRANVDGSGAGQGTQQLTEINSSFPAGTYRSAVYVKGTVGVQVYAVLRATSGANNTDVNSASTALNGGWQRLTLPPITLSNAVSQFSLMVRTTSAVSTSFWVDGAILVEGADATPAYADGTSAGWAWNGAPHYSTSTGPPL